jgi:serine/threonine-protein kinase
LRRFLENKPIEARRPSLGRRIAKWSQRNRKLVAAAVVVIVASAVAAGAVAGWWAREEAAQRLVANHTASAYLKKAADYGKQRDWSLAAVELDQARAVLAGRAHDARLDRQIESLHADAQTALRLDGVRLLAATTIDNHFDLAAADAAYLDAFRGFGIDVLNMPPAAAAEEVQRQRIGAELAEALTSWAIVRKGVAGRGDASWRALLAVAQQADTHRWRGRLRNLLLDGSDPPALAALAAAAPPQELGRSGLFLLLQSLAGTAPSTSLPAEVLREIEQCFPGDFWIRFALARLSESALPPQLEEAVRHYAVAIGIRPTAAAVHNNLGVALKRLGRRDEAITEFKLAISLENSLAAPYANLGSAQVEKREFDAAVAMLQRSLALHDKLAIVHRTLGAALVGQGRVDEAIAAFREAAEREPAVAQYPYDLGNAFQSVGQFEEAIAACRAAIRLNPRDARPRSNLGAILELYGQRAEALDQYREAVRLDPHYFFARRNLARCLQRLGRFSEGLDALRKGAEIDGSAGKAATRFDELIQEAEQLVDAEAQLPALRAAGPETMEPRTAARIAQVLGYTGRYREAAAFFVAAARDEEAFAVKDRYDAACVSLKAASTSDGDGQRIDEAEQARLRAAALTWLQNEKRSWQQRLDEGTVAGRAAARRALRQWQIDPDLAMVRGAAALQLPPAEAAAWKLLWDAVTELHSSAVGATPVPMGREEAPRRGLLSLPSPADQ